MATSKTKLLMTKGKTPSVKLGASSSSKDASPLMPGKKKDYKKKGSESADFGVPGFGDTGMTGES